MKNIILITILSFGLSVKAQQFDVMYNACDKCEAWSPQKTAKFLTQLDQNKLSYKFKYKKPLVILSNSKNKAMNYSIFFEDKDSCEFYLSNFQVKCELLSFAIKH